MKGIILSFVAIFFTLSLSAQLFNRIEAEFTLKESDRVGNKKLSVGKVYYDRNERVVVFAISFPYREQVYITDEAIFRVKGDTLFSKTLALGLIDFNIFHLFLNGNLEYYGLSNSHWKLHDVVQDDGLVISTWLPPKNYPNGGKMLLSQQNKNLSGLLSYNDKEELQTKYIFEEYVPVLGSSFPSQVIQYTYYENEKEVRMSNYRNFKVNEYEADSLYRFPAWLD